MRWVLLLLLWPAFAWADAPKVEPSRIDAKVGVPFLLRVEPFQGKKIGQDGGLDPKKFSMVEVLPNSGVYFVTPQEGSQGEHKVRYWTIGDKITRTIQFDDKPPVEDVVCIPLVSTLTVKVAGAVEPPPPPKKPDDPKQPPVAGLYFMIVRPDGAADPSFTRIMQDPAWATLRTKGHMVKDFDLQRAVALGANLPAGIRLPTVLVLQQDGEQSRVVRGPFDLPTTSEGILLMEGGK